MPNPIFAGAGDRPSHPGDTALWRIAASTGFVKDTRVRGCILMWPNMRREQMDAKGARAAAAASAGAVAFHRSSGTSPHTHTGPHVHMHMPARVSHRHAHHSSLSDRVMLHVARAPRIFILRCVSQTDGQNSRSAHMVVR